MITKAAQAYCTAVVPDAVQTSRINAALDRIAARGYSCPTLAAAGRRLLAAGQLRLFPFRDDLHGGYAALGGDYLILQDDWVDDYATGALSPDGRNLDQALAHELDHHLRVVFPGVTEFGWSPDPRARPRR